MDITRESDLLMQSWSELYKLHYRNNCGLNETRMRSSGLQCDRSKNFIVLAIVRQIMTHKVQLLE